MTNSARLIRGGLSRTEVDLLNAEAWDVRRSNPARAAELCRLTRHRSEETDYRRGVGQARVVEGFLAQSTGEVDTALEACLAALVDLEPDGPTGWLAWAHMIIGHVSAEVGERERAARHYALALRTGSQAGDVEAVAAARLDGALLAQDPAEQLPGLAEAVELFERHDLRAGLGYARYNHAECLLDLGRVEEARPLAALAAEEANEPGMATIRLAARVVEGRCLAAADDLGQARAVIARALQDATGAEPATVAEAVQRLAEIQVADGDLAGAVETLESARDTLPPTSTHTIDLGRRLAECHAELGHYDAAASTLRRLQSQRAAATAERTDRRVAILEILYRSPDAAVPPDAGPALPAPGAGPAPAHTVLRDALTGLPSARRLEQALAESAELVEAAAAADPHAHADARGPVPRTSLALIDIDGLSVVNAELGRPVGDAVLRQLGDLLERAAPSDSLLARLSGEDFGLLLPGHDIGHATAVCEQLRAAVEDHPLSAELRGRRFTVSIGVAQAAGRFDPDRLLRLADDALYEAKETGRNRVVAHASQPSQPEAAAVPATAARPRTPTTP